MKYFAHHIKKGAYIRTIHDNKNKVGIHSKRSKNRIRSSTSTNTNLSINPYDKHSRSNKRPYIHGSPPNIPPKTVCRVITINHDNSGKITDGTTQKPLNALNRKNKIKIIKLLPKIKELANILTKTKENPLNIDIGDVVSITIIIEMLRDIITLHLSAEEAIILSSIASSYDTDEPVNIEEVYSRAQKNFAFDLSFEDYVNLLEKLHKIGCIHYSDKGIVLVEKIK